MATPILPPNTKDSTSENHKTTTNPPQQIMVGSVVTMSWQLAVAVLLPLLAGHWLDKQFGTEPYLTLTGLILAMAGMVVVVRRAVRDLNKYMTVTQKDTK